MLRYPGGHVFAFLSFVALLKSITVTFSMPKRQADCVLLRSGEGVQLSPSLPPTSYQPAEPRFPPEIGVPFQLKSKLNAVWRTRNWVANGVLFNFRVGV